MPPLDRTFAFAEMNTVAVLICQYLDLDMPRPLDIAFDVNRAVLECRESLGLCQTRAGWPSSSSVRTIRIPRPPPPAAALMITGNPIFFAEYLCLVSGFDRIRAAGQNRNAGRGHRPSCLDLIAHHADHIRSRPDEFDVAVFADLGEGLGFGKKAISRMDGVDVSDLGRTDDRGNIQIALGRRRRSDAYSLIGISDMQSFAISLGMHGDGLYPHLLARPNDPARDLATIGYQNFADLARTHQILKAETPKR